MPTGTLAGNIKNAFTLANIENAEVRAYESDGVTLLASGLTDSTGNYSFTVTFSGADPHPLLLQVVRKPGFHELPPVETTLASAGTTTTDFRMDPPRYCTIQDVRDFTEFQTTDISDDIIGEYILRAENTIDATTGRAFRPVFVLNEVYDGTSALKQSVYAYQSDYTVAVPASTTGKTGRAFQLQNFPIISVSRIEKATRDANGVDTWTAVDLNRVRVYKRTGQIVFLQDDFSKGIQNWRCSYTHGTLATPKLVEDTAVLIASVYALYSKILENPLQFSYSSLKMHFGDQNIQNVLKRVDANLNVLGRRLEWDGTSSEY